MQGIRKDVGWHLPMLDGRVVKNRLCLLGGWEGRQEPYVLIGCVRGPSGTVRAD